MHTPAADRTVVDRLAYLRRAGSANRPLRVMERKAARVPIEPAMRNDTPRLTFQVGDDVFIANIENAAGRQHPVPMLHQRLVMPIIPAKLGQIISVILFLGEQFGEAGQAGVDRIADRVDYSCIR